MSSLITRTVAGAIALAALLLSFQANAAVYRCGDTFSDSPCGDDAVEHEVFGEGAESTANLDDKAAQTCLSALVAQHMLGNPKGVVAAPASKRKSRVIKKHGTSLMGYELTVAVREMNPNTGMFNPPIHFQCVLTPDLLRVLEVVAPGGSGEPAS